MSRRSFTSALAKLIDYMISEGDEPVIDYVLRSCEEQNRLYRIGRTQIASGEWIDGNENHIVTKVDGYKKRSKHQDGLAADIYLVKYRDDGSVYVDYNWTDKYKVEKYHKKWEEFGGDPAISWDAPHYQFSK